MSLDQAKYIFEIICKKKNQKTTRSQNYEKAPKKKTKRRKNISFGSLKTNTELPVQRWWFKFNLKLRTDFFLMLVVFL
jgi:hypothetical protein